MTPACGDATAHAADGVRGGRTVPPIGCDELLSLDQLRFEVGDAADVLATAAACMGALREWSSDLPSRTGRTDIARLALQYALMPRERLDSVLAELEALGCELAQLGRRLAQPDVPPGTASRDVFARTTTVPATTRARAS